MSSFSLCVCTTRLCRQCTCHITCRTLARRGCTRFGGGRTHPQYECPPGKHWLKRSTNVPWPARRRLKPLRYGLFCCPYLRRHLCVGANACGVCASKRITCLLICDQYACTCSEPRSQQISIQSTPAHLADCTHSILPREIPAQKRNCRSSRLHILNLHMQQTAA